ncbi:MAG: hypothetical protein HXS47_11545 [Theionarchaea archaeon]|nr:hypothetical protein [Theionarchaea archaeon]
MMYWWVGIWFLLGVAACAVAVYYAYQELYPETPAESSDTSEATESSESSETTKSSE